MSSISQLEWTVLACSHSCWHALQPLVHWISCRVESSDALQSVWRWGTGAGVEGKGPHGGHGSTAALVLGKINPAWAEAKEHGPTGQTSFSKEVMKGNEMQHVGGNKKRKAGCRCCWILIFPSDLCGLLVGWRIKMNHINIWLRCVRLPRLYSPREQRIVVCAGLHRGHPQLCVIVIQIFMCVLRLGDAQITDLAVPSISAWVLPSVCLKSGRIASPDRWYPDTLIHSTPLLITTTVSPRRCMDEQAYSPHGVFPMHDWCLD